MPERLDILLSLITIKLGKSTVFLNFFDIADSILFHLILGWKAKSCHSRNNAVKCNRF